MRILDLATILGLGAGLGLVSAHWAVAGRPVVGKVEVGSWMAWPGSGSRDVDPYMRAYLARGVHLPIGAGEGLELIAERSDDGAPLEGRCRYRVSGTIPPSRGWTLGVTDGAGRPFHLPLERVSFTDSEIVRGEDGGLSITAAAAAQAGNWLPLPAGGRFQLRLRLYDTPVSSQTGETRAANLPRITRIDCR
ncbi:DUF1214 domain-containing protein [Bosea sp. UNC402CLCol]|uniref:DUF1214 domain-containing protein n=1 Tax=Bosea sp. UNC402CLCol TaxID=1510531 RepID=UPI000571CDB6|nr:DUF1214 domain-containing protein [Bosea sp. UNC402CLCol]